MEIKYNSIFKKEITSMLLYEKAMNFKYCNKSHLCDLDNYFISINKENKQITETEFNNYIYNYTKSNLNIYNRYLIILKFCKFLVRFGNTNIFFEEINFNNDSCFEPHIYSEDEMKKILLSIDRKTYSNKNLSYEYPVLFRLLFSTGLRISEVLNIKFKNVNLDDNSIDIMLSKENISRKIYFSNSMKKVIIKYFKLVHFDSNSPIFTTTEQNTLSVFKDVVNELNITTNSTRLHDIRHSFAVRALEQMIKNNIEPEEALLYLEKYMGHSNISSTEYYLHMTDNMKKEIINTMENKIPDLYPKIKDSVNYE